MNETKRAPKPLTRQQRYWLEHIKACEASGRPVAVYAREQGLAAQALYNWKSRLSKLGVLSEQTRPVPFQAVRVVTERPMQGGCRIVLPNGIRAEFSAESDPVWLGQVLSVAGALG